MNLTFTSSIKKWSYLIVALLPFLVYFNAINNEFGMDDYYVTEGNQKTADGISAIPDIFTSYYAENGEVQYEYRPLVLSTYAIEKSLFGGLPLTQTPKEKAANDVLTQANVSHVINVLLYSITAVVLLYLLTLLFANYPFILSLIITVIFVVHPLHTEPVNNLKSRDELLMLLCVLGSLIYFVRYAKTNLKKHLIPASVFVFLAFLSKMNAFVLFGLIPVIFYYLGTKNKQIFISWGVVGVLFALLFIIRDALPGEPFREFQYFENPLFVNDGLSERIPLALYCAYFYTELLVFPEQLSFYYGYNQIPLADWSYWQLWVSVLVLIPLGIYAIIRWWKKDILGLALVLWLGVMVGSVNLTYALVGVVAERFSYLFSIGFAMVLGILIWRLYAFAKTKTSSRTALIISGALFLFITGLYSGRTIRRNDDWENRITLFRNDIQHLNNSLRANTFLGDELFAQLPDLVREKGGTAFVREAQNAYQRALEIYPDLPTARNNLGAINYLYYQDYQAAVEQFEAAKALDVSSTNMLLNTAYSYALLENYPKSIENLKEVIVLDPSIKKAYTFLGGLHQKPAAREAVLKAYSELPTLNKGVAQQKIYWLTVAQTYAERGVLNVASDSYAKAFLLDREDKALGAQVVQLYTGINDTAKAAYFQKLLDE